MSITSLATPLRIYLIRHCETDWALARRFNGRTDITLTANGEAEARNLAQRLEGVPFTQILTSPLQRARQTCRLADIGKLPEIEAELAEWNYGDYEGMRSLDIRRQRLGWNLFQDGCPQGETPEQVGARADNLFSLLRRQHGNIALFSHGQFGSVLAARWVGLPVTAAVHFPLATASISIFAFDPYQPEVPVIALWNSVAPRQQNPPATLADAALQL